jgi:hypothetical protein
MTDVDGLVERLVEQLAGLAGRASALTRSVAIVAAAVFGAAYLVGLAALGGGQRTVWAVVGGLALLVAVGAPLLATRRLRSIPKRTASLIGELRQLVDRDDDARRVVIDTVEVRNSTGTSTGTGAGTEAEPTRLGAQLAARGMRGDNAPPVILRQFQTFAGLRRLAAADGLKNVRSVAESVASLPGLIGCAIALTGIGAVLGFVFTLIWIF